MNVEMWDILKVWQKQTMNGQVIDTMENRVAFQGGAIAPKPSFNGARHHLH
jgi:hypothetical protein